MIKVKQNILNLRYFYLLLILTFVKLIKPMGAGQILNGINNE